MDSKLSAGEVATVIKLNALVDARIQYIVGRIAEPKFDRFDGLTVHRWYFSEGYLKIDWGSKSGDSTWAISPAVLFNDDLKERFIDRVLSGTIRKVVKS